MNSDFEIASRGLQERVEAVLSERLPDPGTSPRRLHQAMRYTCLNGGKRVRAMLVYAAGESLGVALETLDTPACAVELIHAYSLVHDDLPAMDDDDLRRGRPTCHIQFDEATAILVGDALQSLAFEIIANGDSTIASDRRLDMTRRLAAAIGSRGMVGGQAMDIAAVGTTLSLDALKQVHTNKTGALIRASVALGALASPHVEPPVMDALDSYANNIGLAFQVIDDVLDEEADTETLGKTSGADRAMNKPTYPALLGLSASRQFAQELYEAALGHVAPLGEKGSMLRQLATLVVKRAY